MKTVIRGMGVVALVMGLVVGVAACSSNADTSARPTPTAATPVPTTHSVEDTSYYGAATASVAERIYASDVVVRATLLSASDDLLRFRAVEYLRGSGATEFTVSATTANRNTAWDGQEAVLFLALPKSGGGSGSSDSTASLFEFADTTTWNYGEAVSYTGALPAGHTIDSRNPVWMPAQSGGAGGTSGSTTSAYITESTSPAGVSQPSISLADLRTKIAWIGGGKGIAGYAECVLKGLKYERHFRDLEVYYQSPIALHLEPVQISSGTSAIVYDYGGDEFLTEPAYNVFWLSGTDAGLFHSTIIDDDTTASNGYTVRVITARPLPSGVYRFFEHYQAYRHVPCNFRSPHQRMELQVTVTAPTGTVHEAFFDPVTIGNALGADSDNGTLHPVAFSLADASSSIASLGWEKGKVTLALSPYVSLGGKTLDVIELDGTVSLALAFDDGSVDSTAGTVAWGVDERPWESGDRLMIRIR